MNWIEKHQAYVWEPFAPLKRNFETFLVKEAKGCYLTLEDDRKILDAISSWWVNIHGHSHPKIAEALFKQASTAEHVIFAGFTHKPAIQLAENLLSILPDSMQKIFFSDNGSTSVEVAIKLAIQYWYNQEVKDKKRIVALEGAYHGDTFGAMAMGGKSDFYPAFHDYMLEVESLPFPSDGVEQQTIDAFENLAKQGDVALFIYEPLIQGSAGMRIYSHATLQALLEIAKKYDIICIADEVMTGFGRTGKTFASDYMDIKPDLMCISKAVTGTMPLGLTAVSEKIVKIFDNADKGKAFYHGHSYTGNPLSCAVANASFEIFQSDECQQNIQRVTNSHKEVVSRLEQHPFIDKVKSLGTIISLEVKTGENTSYFNNLRDWLYNSFLEEDVLLRPLGNVIYILPPYIITNEELERVYSTIEKVLTKLADGANN
ncbi:MAG: adenosylmethionine--8-amino-7-oxononanoate transaminase [Cytophagales bacterium]|nr:adenosylmethionine--8-amino-7-oxononanoate transaminase [Cytophagales bacterium]